MSMGGGMADGGEGRGYEELKAELEALQAIIMDESKKYPLTITHSYSLHSLTHTRSTHHWLPTCTHTLTPYSLACINYHSPLWLSKDTHRKAERGGQHQLQEDLTGAPADAWVQEREVLLFIYFSFFLFSLFLSASLFLPHSPVLKLKLGRRGVKRKKKEKWASQ